MRLVDPARDFLGQQFVHIFNEVFLLEDEVALGINALALRIEHIIVLQGVFADIKIGAFHACLRLFDHVADQAGQSIATVTSAAPIAASQLASLTKSLTKIYGRELRLNLEIDPSIIGGLRVQVGDDVIDGSVSSRITATAHAQIEAERQSALVSLRGEVGSLALDLATGVIGQALTDDAKSKALVDRFLADLESSEKAAK